MNPKLDYLNFLQSNKKYINDKSNFIVVAFYKFFELQNLEEFKDILRLIFNDTLVKGTILLAKEGINGTIAGMPNEIKNVLDELWNLDNLNDLEAKYSLAPQNPFFRMKIRLKKEIVTLGIDNISPKKELMTFSIWSCVGLLSDFWITLPSVSSVSVLSPHFIVKEYFLFFS